MGLVYDQESRVSVDPQIEDQEYTAYLNGVNIAGRSQDIQTEKWAKTITIPTTISDAGETESYTLTEDVILTEVQFILSAQYSANPAWTTLALGFNTTATYDLNARVDCYTATCQNNIQTIKIPNWLLKKGMILYLYGIVRASSTGYGSVNLIGYKA